MNTNQINSQIVGNGAWSIAYKSIQNGYVILYTIDPLKKVLCQHQEKSIHFPKRKLLTSQVVDNNLNIDVYRCKLYKRSLSVVNSNVVQKLQDSINFIYSDKYGSSDFRDYFHEWVLKIQQDTYKSSIKRAIKILCDIYMPFNDNIDGLYFDIRNENILETRQGTLILNDPFSFFGDNSSNMYIDDISYCLKEVYNEWD